MSAVVEFVGDVFEGVVDAVGDVVEAVGDVVEEAVDFVGNVVESVVENPLPTLLSIAGAAIGIPPMLTSAVVTAAQGGDLQDIVLSAGMSYIAPTVTNAVSSTLSSAIGDAIINETVSNVVVDGVSRGLVNGTMAEIKGGDFEDGFAGAFTGTLVTGGVTELTNFVAPDIVNTLVDAGVSTDTANSILNAGTRAVGAGLTAEITGRGDFDTAFTNSVINSTSVGIANSVTNSISNQFDNVISTNNEIVGAQEGDVFDEEEVSTQLANAWENRDINTINDLLSSNQLTSDDVQNMFDLTDDDMSMLSQNGLSFYSDDEDTSVSSTLFNTDTGSTIGTGAGINSTLVDEVETTFDGENTGDATDVVSNDSTTFLSNDLSGTTSVSTLSGSDTSGLSGNTTDTQVGSWLDTSNQEDVTDLIETYGGTGDDTEVITDDEDVVITDDEDEGTSVITSRTGDETTGGLTAVSGAGTGTPGGLTAVGPTVITDGTDLADGRDLTGVDTSVIDSGSPEALGARVVTGTGDVLSQVAPDVSAYTEEGQAATDVAGGLNKLVDTGTKTGSVFKLPGVDDPAKAITGALTGALRQGITKSLRGALTRTPTKTMKMVKVPKKKTGVTTVKRAPTTASLSGLQAVPKGVKTAVPPKKVNVKTLTPVSNITGLSNLLGGKG